MRRVNLFLILLIASITALIAATIVGFAIFSQQNNPYGWMSQMWNGNSGTTGSGYGGMGGMMGGYPTATATPTASSTILPYFGALFAVLIGVTVVGVVGVGYYLVYPQIRMGTAPLAASLSQPTSPSAAYESVSKTLTEDERKIVNVLQSHQGKYLQKYIKSETGLSRLQTHRILARLSERGVVSLEKTGNTNQVYLADWLNQKP
jgi:hypothetical protein